MTDKALLDANVLVPIHLCDLLLRAAEAGLFRPRWSDEILRETRRAVARALGRRGLDPTDFMPSIDRRIEDMQKAFPDASVAGWEADVARITLPDPDDRHVLAAARHCGATTIVTQNVDDFPLDTLPAGVHAIDADAFLLQLLERSTPLIVGCIRAQARDTGKAGRAELDVEAVLARVSVSAPEFVTVARKRLEGS